MGRVVLLLDYLGGYFADFRRLQSRQSIWQFSATVVPLTEYGGIIVNERKNGLNFTIEIKGTNESGNPLGNASLGISSEDRAEVCVISVEGRDTKARHAEFAARACTVVPPTRSAKLVNLVGVNRGEVHEVGEVLIK